ncbi:MAG: hypothetical protein OXH03_06930 [Bacteroidetes bacterium]|nr:hypothetical protein [Bacteroidota bacterium]MDE2673143.1 hypothetical protein [Bacteroidota bacterium]
MVTLILNDGEIQRHFSVIHTQQTSVIIRTKLTPGDGLHNESIHDIISLRMEDYFLDLKRHYWYDLI